MAQIRILANDGIEADGKLLLSEAGIEVDTERVPQEDLAEALQNYDGIIVRSATKVRKELIDQCPRLKIIGRAGVGLDNIDVEYARNKGIVVFNTPAASSLSVAELVFAHAFTIARSLHLSNRTMPTEGSTGFKALKKTYSDGFELRDKTMGIIGFGRIGKEVARIAVGLGMRVILYDPYVAKGTVSLDTPEIPQMQILVKLKTSTLEKLLFDSDIITLHVPGSEEPIIGKEEIKHMKDGAILINAARGGIIDEDALLDALESGKLRGVGLDVFEGEPTPREDLLKHPAVSISPHIGASTAEAQTNIGLELADKILEFLGK